MSKEPLKVVSLFCGAGGADLGLLGDFSYLQQHFNKHNTQIVHASDIDAKAVQTYNANFGHQAVCADVTTLSFSKGYADIVVGGFPCQNFSTVNPTKDPENKDNQLFWELSRVVDEIRPKVFIGENVKGFSTLKKGKYLNMAIQEFERLGYTVKWKLLNASHFGIPQLRERVFMIGVRSDLPYHENFCFPSPTHGVDLKPIVPLKSVLIDHDTVGEKYYFSERAVRGAKNSRSGMKKAVHQDENGPCLTITSHLAKVSLNSRDPVLLVDPKNERYRRFSPLEAARIQSFPDTFEFIGSQAAAYRQIGNAVPPVVMWHLMTSIHDTLYSSLDRDNAVINEKCKPVQFQQLKINFAETPVE